MVGKLSKAGLQLKPSKCELFRTSLSYFGHVVSKNGTETEKKKTEAITNWPIPVNVSNIRSFLGFANYYRCFVPKYAYIVRPLNLLTSSKNASAKTK